MRVLYPWFIALLLLAPLLLLWLRRTPRRLAPMRRRLLSGLRLLALLLLIGGLVRLALTQPYEQANVVFALDLSHSVSAAVRRQALDFVRAVSGAKRPQDGAGLVVFGRRRLSRTRVAKRFSLPDIASEVDGSATNIARAMQGQRRRFSCRGRQAIGAAERRQRERRLGGRSRPDRPLPSVCRSFRCRWGAGSKSPRCGWEKLIAPKQVRMARRTTSRPSSSAASKPRASLELFREGSFVARQEVVLRPGKNRHRFLEQAKAEGMQLYQIVVNSPRDTMPENNHWQAFTEVRGRPKVLRLYDPPDREAPLVQALQAAGASTCAAARGRTCRTCSAITWSTPPIVFDNVPGFGNSVSQMEVLEALRARHGRRRADAGAAKRALAPAATTARRWRKSCRWTWTCPPRYRSPAWRWSWSSTAPTAWAAASAARRRRVSATAPTKLEVAKIAAFSSMKLLNPFDQVGVLAFNAEWDWSVPDERGGPARADRRAPRRSHPRRRHRPVQGPAGGARHPARRAGGEEAPDRAVGRPDAEHGIRVADARRRGRQHHRHHGGAGAGRRPNPHGRHRPLGQGAKLFHQRRPQHPAHLHRRDHPGVTQPDRGGRRSSRSCSAITNCCAASGSTRRRRCTATW